MKYRRILAAFRFKTLPVWLFAGVLQAPTGISSDVIYFQPSVLLPNGMFESFSEEQFISAPTQASELLYSIQNPLSPTIELTQNVQLPKPFSDFSLQVEKFSTRHQKLSLKIVNNGLLSTSSLANNSFNAYQKSLLLFLEKLHQLSIFYDDESSTFKVSSVFDNPTITLDVPSRANTESLPESILPSLSVVHELNLNDLNDATDCYNKNKGFFYSSDHMVCTNGSLHLNEHNTYLYTTSSPAPIPPDHPFPEQDFYDKSWGLWPLSDQLAVLYSGGSQLKVVNAHNVYYGEEPMDGNDQSKPNESTTGKLPETGQNGSASSSNARTPTSGASASRQLAGGGGDDPKKPPQQTPKTEPDDGEPQKNKKEMRKDSTMVIPTPLILEQKYRKKDPQHSDTETSQSPEANKTAQGKKREKDLKSEEYPFWFPEDLNNSTNQ